MNFLTEDILKLGVTVLVGGVKGLEREVQYIEQLRKVFRESHLRVAEDHFEITEETISSTWRTIGKPSNQNFF